MRQLIIHNVISKTCCWLPASLFLTCADQELAGQIGTVSSPIIVANGIGRVV